MAWNDFHGQNDHFLDNQKWQYSFSDKEIFYDQKIF